MNDELMSLKVAKELVKMSVWTMAKAEAYLVDRGDAKDEDYAYAMLMSD